MLEERRAARDGGRNAAVVVITRRRREWLRRTSTLCIAKRPLVNKGMRKGTFPMSESLLERRRTRRKLTAGALVEIGASLSDVDWRLLHWLLRYPLQRADDLVVGVARWTSR